MMSRRLPGYLLLFCIALAGCRPSSPPMPEAAQPAERADVSEQVHQFCGACHQYPPPDVAPRKRWEFEVRRGFKFFKGSNLDLAAPPVEDVIKYYQDRAPLALPPADIHYATTPLPVRLEPFAWPGPGEHLRYAISNVQLVPLFGGKRPDILACDMNGGDILALRPYDSSPAWKVLGSVRHPAHAEVIDLDGDGILDILVADLGTLEAIDALCGRVVWLRGDNSGSFTAHTLLENVGRVADVQAADFRGTGKLDVLVAEFGLHRNGSIRLLENHTVDAAKPNFKSRTLDGRPGTIHVPVVDLNHDGKPDFIALISQEFETVVAFINEGGGNFRKETIFAAPHPAYGSSGIQLVDMNRDGRLDILYTNGDTLDRPPLRRPWHGIQWLENPGDGTFPWKHHPVAPMYGVHRAVAADIDGDGDMDIVAVAFLPENDFPERKEKKYDAVIVLEQTSPGNFARHVLQSGECDHVSCAVADVMGQGRLDVVVGNFGPGVKGPVTIWRNMGKGH